MTITINGRCKPVINPKRLSRAFKQAAKSKVAITEIETGELSNDN